MPLRLNITTIGAASRKCRFIIPAAFVIAATCAMIFLSVINRKTDATEAHDLAGIVELVDQHKMMAVKITRILSERQAGLPKSDDLAKAIQAIRKANSDAAALAGSSEITKFSQSVGRILALGRLVDQFAAEIAKYPDADLLQAQRFQSADIALAYHRTSDLADQIVKDATALNGQLSAEKISDPMRWDNLLETGLSGLIVLTLLSYLIYVAVPARAKMRSEANRFSALSEDMWKLTMVARRSTDAVIITDTTGHIEWVNGGFEAITGYSLDDVKGLKPGYFLQFAETDPATIADISAAIKDCRPIRTEIRNRGKDGRHFWLSIDIQPLVSSNGEHVGFMAIQSDITAFKQTLADLSARNINLSMMSELARVGVWSVDVKAGGLMWSDQVRKIHDVDADFQPDATSALSFFPEAAQQKLIAMFEAAKETGKDWTEELELITARGALRKVRVFGRPTFTNGEPAMLVGAIMDVTELVETRDNALRVQSRLEQAAESAALGLWEWDVDTDRSYTSPSWWKRFGFDAPTGEMQGKFWDSRIHPDDLELVVNRRNAFVSGLETQLTNEFRFRDSQDDWRWISVVGQATERDSNGRVRFAHGVNMDIHAQRISIDKVRHATRHDLMTGLLNRQEIRRLVDEDMIGINAKICLVVLDLDKFKHVNDSYGHAAGDCVLKTIASRIQSMLRDGDALARLGGDEFAIAIPFKFGGEAFAASFAGRLRATVSNPIDYQGNKLVIGASIGLVLSPDHGLDFESLLINANFALDKVKTEGRNGFQLFSDDMLAEASKRRRLEHDLAGIIHRDELYLAFQKQVRLSDGKLVAAEALLRWNHPVLGNISPDVFIPIAEETDGIIQIGKWVIEAACGMAASWPEPIVVSVNVSASQLGKSDLFEWTTRCLATSGLPADRLEIEVTESIFLKDDERLLLDLVRLHDIGVKLALDDFGTGYASLGYLQRLPFDKIKLDRSFVSSLGASQSSLAIVSAIGGLAQNLGIEAVAEGVETDDQLKIVSDCGFTFAQGFFLGRPGTQEKLFQEGQTLPKTG